MARVEYADARDFFGAVGRAAREAERTRRTIERMEAAEGVRAQSYSGGGRGSRADVNGMGRTEARIDMEERMRRRLEADYALLATASRVLYGQAEDGRGGVAAITSTAHADVLWFRHCDGSGWARVADAVGMSESWCRRAEQVALDACDAYGMERVVSGEGIACD